MRFNVKTADPREMGYYVRMIRLGAFPQASGEVSYPAFEEPRVYTVVEVDKTAIRSFSFNTRRGYFIVNSS